MTFSNRNGYDDYLTFSFTQNPYDHEDRLSLDNHVIDIIDVDNLEKAVAINSSYMSC